MQQARIQEAAAEYRKEGGSWRCTGHRAVGREKKRMAPSLPCVEQPTALRLDRRVCPRVHPSDDEVGAKRKQLLVQAERLLPRDFPLALALSCPCSCPR